MSKQRVSLSITVLGTAGPVETELLPCMGSQRVQGERGMELTCTPCPGGPRADQELGACSQEKSRAWFPPALEAERRSISRQGKDPFLFFK